MKNIEIYTWSWCPYCRAAKSLLKKKGVAYEEYDATESQVAASMHERAGGRTSVPQIFIDDQHIGGYDDMAALDKAGKLDEMLSDSGGAAGTPATGNAAVTLHYQHE